MTVVSDVVAGEQHNVRGSPVPVLSERSEMDVGTSETPLFLLAFCAKIVVFPRHFSFPQCLAPMHADSTHKET
jgi:hypothetical protein